MKIQSLIARSQASQNLASFSKWSCLALGLFGSKTLWQSAQSMDWRGAAFGLGMLLQSANHLWCMRLLRQGRFETALQRSILGILGLYLVAAVHADGNPVVAIVPLLAVVLAMPHTSPRDFKRILIAAWLLLVLNLLVWALAPVESSASIAARAFDHAFSSGAGVGVAFMLLWQFKEGLADGQAQRGEAREAAQREDERYRQIVATTQEGIWMGDLDGKVLFANPRMEEMLGLPPQSMAGQSILSLVSDRWQSFSRENLERNRRGESVQQDIYVQLPNGSTVWLMVSGRPLLDAASNVYGSVTSVTDVSELRRMQIRLNQAMGLDAQGRLAGGVAHDFNNVLAVISGSSDLMARTVKDDLRAMAALDSIRDAARQASALIRRLLSFSKLNPGASGNADLSSLIQDLLPLLQRLAGSNVRVEFIPSSLPAWVRCEAGILEQILLNLVIHARADQHLDGHLILKAEIGESLVQLQVGGLAFEKSLSPGLSAVVESATQAGALVDFGAGFSGQDSNPVLQLSFPRASMLELSEEAPAAAQGKAILLVDDDEDVRNMAARALSLDGLEVQTASSAAQALGFFKAEPQRFAMLITDIIMPGGFGTELAQDLKTIKPELRVLFLSGYIGDDAIPSGELPRGSEFLPKPFATQDLVSKARSGLASRP